MYCLLNWTSPDFSDLSLSFNSDGSVELFDTFNEAEKESLLYNGYTQIVELR